MNTGNFPTNDIWLDESIITNQSSRRLQPYSEFFHNSIFKRTCHFVSLLQDGAENVVKSLQGTVCPCSTMTTILSPGIFSYKPIQHLRHTTAVTMKVCCLPLTAHHSCLLHLHSMNCTQSLLLPFFWGTGDQIPIHIGAVSNDSIHLKNIMSLLQHHHLYQLHHIWQFPLPPSKCDLSFSLFIKLLVRDSSPFHILSQCPHAA